VRERRRLALAILGGLALLGLVAGLVVGASAGDDDEAEAGGSSGAEGAELPRGGRRIFPHFRVVAYYGAPQSEELGALGIGTPADAAFRLERQARAYRRPGRPVLPAFELIAVVANRSAGADGDYNTRQSPATIRTYLAAARRARALLLLDIQPGTADFLTEVRALEPYLRDPDVGLALDPEWHVRPGQLPGQVLGSVDAGVVNAVAARLAEIVRVHRLPEKLLVVHQFTRNMVRRKETLTARPGVALVLDVDGFGTRAEKTDKYNELTAPTRNRFAHGFKLFYREDTDLMDPSAVLALRPQPRLVVYE
jgi:hypothetical protein